MLPVARLARQFFREPATRLPHDAAYALWAETYPARPHNRLMQAEQDAMVPLIEQSRPRRALDLGTGTGRYVAVLRDAGAWQVTALDRAAAMLAGHRGGAALVRGDARALPFRPDSVDVVVSSLMVGDLAELGPWFRDLARIIRPGGHLVYSDFHPTWREHDWRRTFSTRDGGQVEIPFHPHSLDEHLAGLAAAGFDVRTIREPRVPVPVGGLGPGRALPVVVVVDAVRRLPPGVVIRS